MFVFLVAVASARPDGAPLEACATFTPVGHGVSSAATCDDTPFGLYVTAMDEANDIDDDDEDGVFEYVANATYRSNRASYTVYPTSMYDFNFSYNSQHY